MITINNIDEAHTALESSDSSVVGEGIAWIGNNANSGVHYEVGYLISLVAALNMKINHLEMDNDYLKEDNDHITEIRDIGNQVQQIYDRVV